MPGMSGFELLREARQAWPGLPVAMITAYGDDDSRERATELGATAFLTKPIDFAQLKETVGTLLDAGPPS